MDKSIDVAVIGDINVDLIFLVDYFPSRGGNCVAKRVEKRFGGVGGNRAAALARLGLSVALIGAVGGDEFGKEALKELKEYGVDIDHVKVLRDQLTGLMIVAVDREAERTIIGSRESNSKLRIGEEDLRLVEGAKHLHVAGYQMLNEKSEDILRIIKHARKLGVSTSMDVEGVADLNHETVKRLKGILTYVMGNEDEAKALVGVEESEEKLAEKLLQEFKADVAVVKLGEKGCAVADRRQSALVPGFKVDVVDTTGAGDAFNAGFIYGTLKGLSPVEAARLANAVGAYKCTKLGAKNYPTIDELVRRFPSLKGLRFKP
ncbi:MAG: hypothetical protein B6U65_00580 [Candidatus Wolframiiraptor sp. EX4484-121]|nr:MAG: hypothetical protein B6U65_00580 [Candidatus Wolframiiraptor sp. EX4484-121]